MALGSGAHVRCFGKGRKERVTPLTAPTVAVLRAWLQERHGEPSEPLFPTSRGGPLSRDAVERLLSPEGVRERLRRDRTAAEAEGEPGEVLDPARRRGDAAGVRFLLTGPQVTIRVAPKAIKRLKDQLRILTRHSWGVSMAYRIDRINRFTTGGWMAYFQLADSERMLRNLDGWLRRRLRQVRWKEWKTTAAKRHNLRIRGISESSARKWGSSSKGYWRVAGSKILQVSLPNTYWNRLGLKTLSQTWQRLNPTA